MIKKAKPKDIEVLKLVLKVGEFQNDNTFKASIGQRGLNLREVLTYLNDAFSTYEEGTEVNVRFEINLESKNLKIDVLGPTSTFQVLNVLGNVKERLVTKEEIKKVYETYPEYWEQFRLKACPEKSMSMIRGKLMSMGAFLEERE